MNTTESHAPASALTAWIAAFNRHDVDGLVALYDPGAVLWGTTAPLLISTTAGVRQYFEQTFVRAPAIRATVGDFITQRQGELDIYSGGYVLDMPGPDGHIALAGRFTFTFRPADSGWIIVNHHSSMVPAAGTLAVR